jgi:hypothetical protein
LFSYLLPIRDAPIDRNCSNPGLFVSKFVETALNRLCLVSKEELTVATLFYRPPTVTIVRAVSSKIPIVPPEVRDSRYFVLLCSVHRILIA